MVLSSYNTTNIIFFQVYINLGLKITNVATGFIDFTLFPLKMKYSSGILIIRWNPKVMAIVKK